MPRWGIIPGLSFFFVVFAFSVVVFALLENSCSPLFPLLRFFVRPPCSQRLIPHQPAVEIDVAIDLLPLGRIEFEGL